MALAAGARQRLYERHKPAVLCVLARRCSFLDPLDRESAYHDAYLTLCEKQREGELDVDTMPSRKACA
jgi:hypothetical protein